MPQAQAQDAGVSPLKVFGKMLKFYRNRSALTSDQLGALVNLSGSAIRKIESGRQAPIEPLVDALEAIGDPPPGRLANDHAGATAAPPGAR